MLQRRLKVGYARAARLVDELEVNHLVSPADGSKPRQVLITWEDYYKMFGGEKSIEGNKNWHGIAWMLEKPRR